MFFFSPGEIMQAIFLSGNTLVNMLLTVLYNRQFKITLGDCGNQGALNFYPQIWYTP